MASTKLEDIDKTYAKDEAYWNTYMKGRPQIPDALFERVARYHKQHHGTFNTVHDVGAGVGVYSHRLAPFFKHVIISDVAASNIDIAKDRLGTDGKYSYEKMSVNDADVLPEGSVDMVFAANMFHYAEFDKAFPAIFKQLKPGGTLAIVGYGHGVLEDPEVDAVWRRIWFEGMRVLCRHAKDRKARLRTLWQSATFKGYETVPLSEEFFERGPERVRLNCEGGEWPEMQPEDLVEEFERVGGVGSAVGPNDKIIAEREGEWRFKVGIKGLREQFEACPFAPLEPAAFEEDWKELEDLMKDGREVEGVWPAAVLLATRRR